MARKRRGIDELKDRVGTFDAPIGSVQLPSTGVRLDRHGNPKALQSGQDEHPEPGAPRERRPKRPPEPELEFTTNLFVQDPAERAVLGACHKALAGRHITVEELRRKLVKAEFEPDTIELAIDRCTAAGLLDDERYVAQFVESRVRRGHGAQRIRQDLAQRGIDRSLVDVALVEYQESGALEDAAVEAARRKFARIDLDEAAAKAKALRWLLSRGYSSSQAYGALAVRRQERADEAP
jgi:regulatory protein